MWLSNSKAPVRPELKWTHLTTDGEAEARTVSLTTTLHDKVKTTAHTQVHKVQIRLCRRAA